MGPSRAGKESSEGSVRKPGFIGHIYCQLLTLNSLIPHSTLLNLYILLFRVHIICKC